VRIAILSDVHGNLTAFEAVCADLREAAPDLVLHGGDLADSGSSPIAIIDRIRDLRWPGVYGNTDEMLFRPAALESFAAISQAPKSVWQTVRAIAHATRETLGNERLAWLAQLPPTAIETGSTGSGVALVHATPESCWQVPAAESSDDEVKGVYGVLNQPIVVHGHTHIPSIRTLDGAGPRFLINTGSVGLPYDGDRRASYLLIEDGMPAIRRVAYDLERELKALAQCGLPGADWTARILRAGLPQLP
jgi:predicted phosphodiesterase